jgi:hypothetical protein
MLSHSMVTIGLTKMSLILRAMGSGYRGGVVGATGGAEAAPQDP